MTLFDELHSPEYATLVAENAFIDRLQLEIERALDRKGMSQVDLARALGVSEARVSQILSGNGQNLRARTIARIAHALEMRPEFFFAPIAPLSSAEDVCDTEARSELTVWTERVFQIRIEEERAYTFNDNFWGDVPVDAELEAA